MNDGSRKVRADQLGDGKRGVNWGGRGRQEATVQGATSQKAGLERCQQGRRATLSTAPSGEGRGERDPGEEAGGPAARGGRASSGRPSGTCVREGAGTRARKPERRSEESNRERRGPSEIRAGPGTRGRRRRASNKNIPLNTVKKGHGGRKSKSKEGIVLHFKIYSARALGRSAPVSVHPSVLGGKAQRFLPLLLGLDFLL